MHWKTVLLLAFTVTVGWAQGVQLVPLDPVIRAAVPGEVVTAGPGSVTFQRVGSASVAGPLTLTLITRPGGFDCGVVGACRGLIQGRFEHANLSGFSSFGLTYPGCGAGSSILPSPTTCDLPTLSAPSVGAPLSTTLDVAVSVPGGLAGSTPWTSVFVLPASRAAPPPPPHPPK